MSKKQPEIKVTYPDASAAAMLLTDAMIRRSTGKRIVETNSEEKEYTGEALFGGVLSTKTDTSVELTLRLNPDAMDYALTMLVAKNLTEEEKRAIRMETDSMEIVDLLSPRTQAACGEDKSSTEQSAATRADGDAEAIDVPLLEAPAEEEKQIEIGKISDVKLREILRDLIKKLNWSAIPENVIKEEIEETIRDIDYTAGVIDLDETYQKEKQFDRDLTKQIAAALNVASLRLVTTEELKQLKNFASSLNAILIDDDEEMQDTYIRIGDLRKELIHARYFGGADADKLYIELQEEINPNTGIPWSEYEAFELRENKLEPPPHEKIAEAAQEREKQKKAKKSRKKKQDPSWEDVEAEARTIGRRKTDKSDKTNEADGEIDAGLLNDIDTEGEDHG